jgi:pilus assembly protein CpaF
MNILISGATGAGKTTLLNALASLISENERIITVEDVAEMQLQHKNWVRLLARPESPGATVRDCLIGSLRMRPDRILVGECRSKETLEMLQIMNTGHEGGMSTIHANSTGDALTRLESLILFHAGAEIPLRALRRQIVDALDLIVHMGRAPTGERYIQEIMEVSGMEGDIITRQSLFKCARGSHELKMTGQVPKFQHQLDAWISRDFFAATVRAA